MISRQVVGVDCLYEKRDGSMGQQMTPIRDENSANESVPTKIKKSARTNYRSLWETTAVLPGVLSFLNPKKVYFKMRLSTNNFVSMM